MIWPHSACLKNCIVHSAVHGPARMERDTQTALNHSGCYLHTTVWDFLGPQISSTSLAAIFFDPAWHLLIPLLDRLVTRPCHG